MSESTAVSEDSATQPHKKMYPSTLSKTRKSVTTLLNEFRADPCADVSRFRAQVYALKAVAEIHRLERDAELETRLERLEDSLQ